MFYIYPENLTSFLNKQFWSCYLIFGNDYFLLKNTTEYICKIAETYEFYKCYRYTIDSKSNWDELNYLFNSKTIFDIKQIYILTLSEKLSPTDITNNLIKLKKFLSYDELLLLIIVNNLNITGPNNIWYKDFKNKSLFIKCTTPKNKRLINWMKQESKKLSISLSKEIINFFCYFYNNNLFNIYQILLQVSLIYKNKQITLENIKNIIHDLANFSCYHFINALFLGTIQESYYILQKLKYENSTLPLLIFLIQNELTKVLMIKIKNDKYIVDKKNFQNYWKSHYTDISIYASNKLSIFQIQTAIEIISKIDLYVKQNYTKNIWEKLEILTILISGVNLSQDIINEI